MIALLVALAVVALLLVAGWATFRDRSRSEFVPTTAEHAAADAGRASALHAVSSPDAVVSGTPAIRAGDELAHRP
jgi:hypothetical protein